MAGRSKTSPVASGPASAASAAGGPFHVAIVMDGNGRWAQKRGLPRTMGHRAGVEALRRTVAAAPDLGVRWLTVFGFSTENWSRPAAEVSELMALPKRYFDSDLKRLEREGVRVRAVGRREGLAPDLVALLNEAEQRTARNDRFFLQIAFNYGGQADIADAARRLAEAAAAGRLDPATINESVFAGSLSTAGLPLPDLIIRPSGEQRLSNFLLWEAAYAELVFQDVLWPDYDAASLADAITAFRSRDRRFGGAVSDDVLVAG